MIKKQKNKIKTYSMSQSAIDKLRANAERLGVKQSALLQHLVDEYAHKVKGE